jgi:Zn-dependent protease with chaperone function
MTLAILLVLYSLAVSVLAPAAINWLSNGGVAPRLALATWGSAVAGVLLAWVLAAALVGRAVLLSERDVHEMVADCLHEMGQMALGTRGPTLQAGLLALAALSGLAVAVLVGRLALALGRARIRTHRHCDAARLMADPSPGPGGSVVLDATERIVYCVAGRPPTIVITRGAVDALDETQMAAVLAHERAHLSGRHHLLLAASRAVATVVPRVRLFAVAADAVAQLVEMRADDVAARDHSRSTLVEALLALSDIRRYPRSALAANGVGVADRVQRLLVPRSPLRDAPIRTVLSIVTAALLVAPVAIAGIATAFPQLCPFPLI